MADEWIVRVEGKEYGPVDFDTLSEWKKEGRVLPTNEVRKVDADIWTTAAEIPELFAPAGAEAAAGQVPSQHRSMSGILVETCRIYLKGFWQFLALNALVFVPSLCGQLTSAAVGSPSNVELDPRTLLAGLFNFAMLLLTIAAWPVYVAGIQILTSELSAGRSVAVVDLIHRALPSWTRVILVCVLVYGAFFLLMLFALGILVMIIAGGSSIFVIFLALVFLVLQIWMFGRLFVNVMFWQQFAVLENAGVLESLRESKNLARSASTSLVPAAALARCVSRLALVRLCYPRQPRSGMVAHAEVFPGLVGDSGSAGAFANAECERARIRPCPRDDCCFTSDAPTVARDRVCPALFRQQIRGRDRHRVAES
jgi:GYF domain 2